MSTVTFRTFGGADLRNGDGAPLRSVLAQPMRVALLSLLASKALGGYARRDSLCGMLWPDADQSQARHRLRSALHMLRKALGAHALPGRGDEEIGVSPVHVWFDVAAFEEAAADGRHAEALELYRGEFLDGFHVDASHEFDEWLRAARERYRRSAADLAKALTHACLASSDPAAAAEWAHRARELAPYDESALRDLVTALDASGRRAEAIRAFEDHAERLERELGTTPAPETDALIQRIRDRTEPLSSLGTMTASGVGGAEEGGGSDVSARAGQPVARRGSSGRIAALTGAVALGAVTLLTVRVARAGPELAAQPAGASLFAFLGSWLILLMGVWFLFERAEETASAEGRRRVANWLRVGRGEDPSGADWAEGFVGAFDRVFGPRHLSLHCFLRSMAVSMLAVTVLLLLWTALRGEQFAAFAAERGVAGLGELVLITFLVNVVADYLSLLETRYAFGLLSRISGSWGRAGILVADVLATLVVWLVFYTGFPLLPLTSLNPTANDIVLFLQFQVWSYAPTLHEIMTLSATDAGPPVGIWFYSTFVTSMWLWLYVGAGGAARMAGAARVAAGRGLAAFASTFDAEGQPFRVLGFAAMLLVTSVYGLGLLWMLL